MEDTVAIGDNFNDVSMLKMAGLGIAKAEPNYVCTRQTSRPESLTGIIIIPSGN